MFDNATLAELATGRYVPRILIKFYFDEGAEGVWSDAGPITVDGITYNGHCNIAEVNGVSSHSDLSMVDVSIVLNNTDPGLEYWFKTKTWHQRRIDVSGVLFSGSMRSVYETPVWRHVGMMEKATISEAENSPATITLKIADLARRSVVGTYAYFTDGSQRLRLSTDSALRYLATISRPEDIDWGNRQSKSGNMSWNSTTGALTVSPF